MSRQALVTISCAGLVLLNTAWTGCGGNIDPQGGRADRGGSGPDGSRHETGPIVDGSLELDGGPVLDSGGSVDWGQLPPDADVHGDSKPLTPDGSSAGRRVGFAFSGYGISPNPPPSYWEGFAKAQQKKFSGSAPEGVWVVGGVWKGGICYLSFPSSTPYTNMAFAATDENEPYLAYFDTHGIKVYLQVEPGIVDPSLIIKLVLDRYSKHPSVIGFGVDAEWYKAPTYTHGKPITDQEAAQWTKAVTAYNPSYALALTHWMTSHMPPSYRQGIYFLYDGLNSGSLDTLASSCITWGKAYSRAGYYIGFTEDKPWWSKLGDPYLTIAQRIFKDVPHATGVYWVPYNIKDIYP